MSAQQRPGPFALIAFGSQPEFLRLFIRQFVGWRNQLRIVMRHQPAHQLMLGRFPILRFQLSAPARPPFVDADVANHLRAVIKQRSRIRRPIESLAILTALDPHQSKPLSHLLQLLFRLRQALAYLSQISISIHEIILPSPTRNEKRETGPEPQPPAPP
jgi:hypothetical protein